MTPRSRQLRSYSVLNSCAQWTNADSLCPQLVAGYAPRWCRRPPASSRYSRCFRSAVNGRARSSLIGSRSGRGRSAVTSTSCARSVTRSRRRRGWPAAIASALGASCRRCCSTTPRPSRWPRPAHRRLRVDRRDRGDLGPRAGQARAGPAGASAAPGQRTQRRHLGVRRRRAADRRRRAGDAWRARAATGSACTSPTWPRTSGRPNATPSRAPSSTAASAGIWSRSTRTAMTGGRSGSTESVGGSGREVRGRRRTVPGGDPAAYVKRAAAGERRRHVRGRPGTNPAPAPGRSTPAAGSRRGTRRRA